MKYQVRLTAEVCDTLETFVEVEADSVTAACVAALTRAAMVDSGGLVWECVYEGYRGPASVDSVMPITEGD
jgi:hypothetical protein